MPKRKMLAVLAAAAVAAALVGSSVAMRSSGARPGSPADRPEVGPPRASTTAPPATRAGPLPTVASINLCTDQLVLSVADPSQIVTLSWLSADPEESTLADAAARYPLNYGSAEEILRFDPDIVIAGVYTNAFTRALLRDLGYAVVDIPPANALEDVETHLRQVGAAIGRTERAEALIREMRARIARHRRRLESAAPVAAVVVRPGGFTVEAPSLAHDMMTLAGLRNLPAEHGLDRWGSLSVETLLHHPPELLVVAAYRSDEASLANAVLAHPALERLAERTVTAEVPGSMWGCGLPGSLDAVALLERAADEARSARTLRTSRAAGGVP